MPTLSRRRFMAGLAAAPLALGLKPKDLVAADAIADATTSKTRRAGALDVAIVGAGVSGLYAAWRLLADPGSPVTSVGVFEGSDYVGGRLLSVSPPGIPDMVAELGAMRFQPAVHRRVRRLIKTLNGIVGPREKIQTYDFPLDRSENISYFRGVRLRYSDVADTLSKVPYRLEPGEVGLSPGEILVNAMERVVPGITAPGLRAHERRRMARNARFDSLPLHKHGLWNVLARVLSWEAFRLCVDTLGYESIFTNWNAADAIPWFLTDFGANPKFVGFARGFQQVPTTLAELVESQGGTIELNQPLRGFEWSGDGFELDFGSSSVEAKALILAMPRRSLELLAPACPLLRGILGLIESVTPQPLFKVFATYNEPWWRPAGVGGAEGFTPLALGRSTTDLPLRQIYYWTRNDGTPVEGGAAMLLASYDDGRNLAFWDGLRRPGRPTSENAATEAGSDAAGRTSRISSTEWGRHRPNERMLKELRRQLAQVHDLPEASIVDAAFKDWDADPFGGGWNTWNIGVRSAQVGRRMIQPHKRERVPLFICGEAYSDYQGWVEGALQTADRVLEKFGLSPSA